MSTLALKLVGLLVVLGLAVLFAAAAGLARLMPGSRPIPPGPSDRVLGVLGSPLRYRIVGDGRPTLILLHGFGSSLDEWEALVPALECGTIVSLDLVGFGGSARPRENYSLETHRRYLVAFLDSLEIESAVLVGRSMGASVAAWTAARSPERIIGAVLMAPSGFPGSLRYPWPRSALFRPGPANRVLGAVAGTRLFGLLFPRSSARQALGVTASYDSTFAAALERIAQPVLLIWSRGDRTVPFAASEEYRQRIPHTELLELPESVGHATGRFDPASTAHRICEFVDRLR